MTIDPGPIEPEATARTAPGRRDEPQIVEFTSKHVADAARLYAADFGRLRADVPALPADFLDPATTEPLLRRAISAGPAAAALRHGELVGYMAGLPVPGLRASGTSVFLPEWAHGGTRTGRSDTYDAMYTYIAARWAEAGWLTQCLSILPGDPKLEGALVWLGFGLCVVDAVRTLEEVPVSATPPGVTVGQAAPEDLDALVPIVPAHDAYYAASPTFLIRETNDPSHELASWIQTRGEQVLFARSGIRVLSFIYLRPAPDDVSRVVRHPGTMSICGAYTVPEARGSGVGSALLSAAVASGREAGFERMAVDFESANVLARRFWLRSFRPVCLTFERHLDDRLARPGTAPSDQP